MHSGDVYHYAQVGNFVLRSQLDAYSPTRGVFDLKTRAVLPIRKDISNYKKHFWYEIKSLKGHVESFEREYYDMLRAAFLKYRYFQINLVCKPGSAIWTASS